MFEDVQPPPSSAEKLATRWTPTARYLFQVEVHVYAFSMAANVLLSFFPLLIVMVSICRYVLGWHAAEATIFLALRDYFPDPLGSFIQRNLQATVTSHGPFQFLSLLLLLYTANGIFEPLEVALNRAWGIAVNRSYLKNQLISLGLIFTCGGFALASIIVAGYNEQLWSRVAGTSWQWAAPAAVTALKLAVVPVSILLLFLVYWILPNGRVPWRPILPVAIVIALLLEALKYINLLTWPWLRAKLQTEYGPFAYSATIILWGFVASMVVLAGAEWSARSRPPEARLQSSAGSG